MSFIVDLYKKFRSIPTHSTAESEPPSQPELTDKIVYSDAAYRIRKIWKWNVNDLYQDSETGLLEVLISGQATNGYGKSVFASVDGKRLTDLSFDIIASFHEGLARVAVRGQGYGFIDKNMSFVIPLKYDYADDFKHGLAKVRRGKQWFFVDRNGREMEPGGKGRSYQEIGDYAEGMCRVSTFNPRLVGLAYHSDYRHMAGTWGFIDEAGEEVIQPQYIYAHDFEDGIAIVAKGKWTLDPKWDNHYNQGCYWTEEELWGGIDKSGNVVIPFIFDEIKFFFDRTDIFMAHYGGWPEGRWGVIDNTGKWLAEPIFEGLYYETQDNLIVFYAEDPVRTANDSLMGIYDLANKKVLLEPQFWDVSFCRDDINVDVFDEDLGRTVQKIIDRSGKERFRSIYSTIFNWKEPYEVTIYDEESAKHGLIDRDGNVILPCIHVTPHNGILYDQKRIHFIDHGKQGVKDFDGNIIVPAIYHQIYYCNEPFLTVSVENQDSRKQGVITADGKPVIPAECRHIGWCNDHKHFFCCYDGYCEMYAVEDCVAGE